MKNITLFLSFVLLITFGVTAQDSDLKGPAYKNRKTWKNPNPATTVIVKDGETKKGAGVKMMLPLERKTGELKTVTFEINRNTLKGPAYKNKKVWQKDESPQRSTEELLAKD